MKKWVAHSKEMDKEFTQENDLKEIVSNEDSKE